MTVYDAIQLAQQTLSNKRFVHTSCVALQAARLAGKYGESVSDAELAAYLHDILKEAPDDVLLQILQGSDIIDLDDIKRCPAVWHAFAGGEYADKVLGVDKKIADAIRYHSTGRYGMARFEMLIYLADYTSADRTFDGAEQVRKIAETSLEDAMLAALVNQISHIVSKNGFLDLNSVRAYDYMIGLKEENEKTDL